VRPGLAVAGVVARSTYRAPRGHRLVSARSGGPASQGSGRAHAALAPATAAAPGPGGSGSCRLG